MKFFKLIGVYILLILSSFAFSNIYAETQPGIFIEQNTITPGQIEEILEYKSDIIVNQDSTIDVTEIITVRALNIEINRGIYRDFPTSHKTDYGLKRKVDFKVKEILKDNKPEPYHTESVGSSTRIYIGEEDVILKPGVYTYTIKYKTERILLVYKESDEFYFNIIGVHWTFPIQKASSTIHLPFAVDKDKLQIEGFTGPVNSTEKNVTIDTQIDEANQKTLLNINLTKPLKAEEGMTVKIKFPSEIIKYPILHNGPSRFIFDNLDILIGILLTLFLLIYYTFIWIKHGIDPKEGTIIPLFSPPAGLAPAEIRYINKEGYDNKAFVSTLVSLGVQGFIKISEIQEKKLLFDKKYFSVTRLTHDKLPESDVEKQLFNNLFENGDEVVFSGTYNSHIASAVSSFGSGLNKKLDKLYFIRNTGFTCFGFFLSCVYLGLAWLFSGAQEAVSFSIFLGIFFAVGVGIFVSGFSSAVGFANRSFSMFFSIVWIGVTLVVAYFAKKELDLYILGIVIFMGMIHAIFLFLIKAPTVEGSKIKAQIDGFKMYLQTAEEDDMRIMNSSLPKTLDLYQKYLPFAIALDVETQWTNKFEKDLQNAQLSNNTSSMAWYSGASAFSSSSIGSISSGISSSVSSSSSSSGSSGGGSGGGGGGGW